MTPAEYKDLFDRSYDECHLAFDIDAYFDPNTPAADLPVFTDIPNDYDVALDMLKAQVAYWEHDGWVAACKTALYMQVFDANYDQAKELASWLMTDAPQSVAYEHPELVNYAVGEFPKEEVAQFQKRMDYWQDVKARAATIVPRGIGPSISFQAYVEQRTGTVIA